MDTLRLHSLPCGILAGGAVYTTTPLPIKHEEPQGKGVCSRYDMHLRIAKHGGMWYSYVMQVLFFDRSEYHRPHIRRERSGALGFSL